VKSFAPQLPTVLGSFAAMLVAFLSLITGASPTTCLIKAMAAFLVFAGLGLILRYAIADSLSENSDGRGLASSGGVRNMSGGGGLDVIVPGTSVADLLNEQIQDDGAEDVGDGPH